MSQLPLSAQAAARNALNEIVATAAGAAGGALAGGGSSGALAGAGSAINNELYNRRLHVEEVKVVERLAQQKVSNGDATQRATAAAIQKAIDNKTLVKLVTGVDSNGAKIVNLK